jgi:general secretion pathway protein G
MVSRRPIAHVLSRGVTLIEVMIVVVILGLIAAAVAVAVFPQDLKAEITMTHTNARTIRNQADAWRTEHGAEACPTPDRLVADKLLDRGSKTVDPWGTPFRILCHDDETTVVSLGPDRKESEDDIVEPEAVAMR